MIFPIVDNMSKNNEAIICFILFSHQLSDRSYGSYMNIYIYIYSLYIVVQLVPTYILPAKEKRLLGKIPPDSLKTERLVFVETDGQTDMARSTRLVMLIKNIYTLWGRKRLIYCVANF